MLVSPCGAAAVPKSFCSSKRNEILGDDLKGGKKIFYSDKCTALVGGPAALAVAGAFILSVGVAKSISNIKKIKSRKI